MSDSSIKGLEEKTPNKEEKNNSQKPCCLVLQSKLDNLQNINGQL